jgi:hypothetical protein
MPLPGYSYNNNSSISMKIPTAQKYKRKVQKALPIMKYQLLRNPLIQIKLIEEEGNTQGFIFNSRHHIILRDVDNAQAKIRIYRS